MIPWRRRSGSTGAEGVVAEQVSDMVVWEVIVIQWSMPQLGVRQVFAAAAAVEAEEALERDQVKEEVPNRAETVATDKWPFSIQLKTCEGAYIGPRHIYRPYSEKVRRSRDVELLLLLYRAK
jgi:hypothetical protein